MAAPMAMVGMGATALGGITGAVGSIFSGQAQSNMYTYQAGIAQMNAQIAKQNASYALAAGEVSAQQQGMKTRAEIGQTKATQGAGGLQVGSGSNVQVQKSEKEIGDENAALTRANAARQAYGFQVEAVQDTAQSQLDLMAAENAKTAGTIGAFSSLLGGGASVSSKWLEGSKQGFW